MKKIEIKDYTIQPFKQLDDEWGLLMAGDKTKANAMTISWANIGIAYNKPTIWIYVRTNRFTKQFIDANEKFSITFYPQEYHQELIYHGNVSGKDEDKIKNTKLSLDFIEDTPYFKEAHTTFICQKLYEDTLNHQNIRQDDIIKEFYHNQEKHQIYLAQIISIYQK